jgi:3-(3-hydroxy-phenyl)propionate hydroxylase
LGQIEVIDVDVAIVGYGPVGATLANLLGVEGIKVALFEREASVFHQPRAGHFDDEVMRIFQTTGLAEAISKTLRLNPGMRFVSAKGEVLINWPRPAEIGPQGWHASYRFHQPTLERILREGVARFGHTVFLQHDVTSVDEHDDHVVVNATDLVNDTQRTIRCRYLIGCDGGRSLVRRTMGSGVDDLYSDEEWLVTDIELVEDMPELGDFTIQHCDPARPVTYARGVGNRRRWELMLVEGDDPRTIAEEDSVWRLLARWIKPTQGRIVRAVVYTFHSIVAKRWRKGRLMLAGDSAHQTPPFLGQGMCAGIRDTANLAWKLAAVLRGEASDRLLDTYETERSPHVRKYIEQAVRLGKLIQIRDPQEAERRDQQFREQPEQMKSIKPALGPGLHGDGAGPAGELAPQPRLRDGRLLDDVVGTSPALLATGSFADGLSASERELCRQAKVVVLADEGLDYLETLGMPAAVIRPDRYLLGTARNGNELRRLLDGLPRVRAGELV